MRSVIESSDLAPMSTDRRSDKCLKILHAAAVGDNAQWLVNQLLGLRERGHSVEALLMSEGRCSAALRDAGIPYTIMDLDLVWKGSEFFQLFPKVLKVREFLNSRQFDVVHYHMFTSSIIVRLAAWMADVPVRVRMVPETFYLESERPAALEFKTCWMDSRIVPTCKFSRDLYVHAGVPQRKLTLAYYGADEGQFDPKLVDAATFRDQLHCEFGITPGAKLIGKIAYFIPRFEKSEWLPEYLWGRSVKNHETLIAAMSKIVQRYPDAKLLLIGGGVGTKGDEYIEGLKSEVRSLGLEDSIFFLGFRDNVPQMLAALDVVVQCSNTENLGGTIESLLMARPTVATAVGGLVDSIIHEDTGLLVPPTDPASLADAICRLLDDPPFAKGLALSGRQLALSKLSLARTVEQLDSLYDKSWKNRQDGYRWRAKFVRSIAGLYWMSWVAWMCCSTDVCNHIQWRLSATLRGAYLLFKRTVDLLVSSLVLPVLLILWVPIQCLSHLGNCDGSGLTTIIRRLSAVWLGKATLVGRLSDADQSDSEWQGIKPGLMGWAHLNRQQSSTAEDLRACDRLYASTCNPILDLKILAKSLITLFRQAKA